MLRDCCWQLRGALVDGSCDGMLSVSLEPAALLDRSDGITTVGVHELLHGPRGAAHGIAAGDQVGMACGE